MRWNRPRLTYLVVVWVKTRRGLTIIIHTRTGFFIKLTETKDICERAWGFLVYEEHFLVTVLQVFTTPSISLHVHRSPTNGSRQLFKHPLVPEFEMLINRPTVCNKLDSLSHIQPQSYIKNKTWHVLGSYVTIDKFLYRFASKDTSKSCNTMWEGCYQIKHERTSYDTRAPV